MGISFHATSKIWCHSSERKKAPAATYPQVRGFKKYGGHFSGEKKAPAATYPQVKGFQTYGGHFSEKNNAYGNVVR